MPWRCPLCDALLDGYEEIDEAIDFIDVDDLVDAIVSEMKRRGYI